MDVDHKPSAMSQFTFGLKATALVHGTYMRLVDANPQWQNHGHFFAVAPKAMRRPPG